MKYRQTIILISFTIVFFAIGQFGYESIYRLTLYSVKSLASVPLRFYGKFPQWIGDIKFSFIIASIPLMVFLISKILRHRKYALAISIAIYSICFVGIYLLVCFWTSLSFHSMNDRYHGEIIEKNLREVKINETFLVATSISAVLTLLILLVVNLVGSLRQKLR